MGCIMDLLGLYHNGTLFCWSPAPCCPLLWHMYFILPRLPSQFSVVERIKSLAEQLHGVTNVTFQTGSLLPLLHFDANISWHLEVGLVQVM